MLNFVKGSFPHQDEVLRHDFHLGFLQRYPGQAPKITCSEKLTSFTVDELKQIIEELERTEKPSTQAT